MDSECQQVVANERRLLAPEIRADTGAALALLHRDFTEFGASGNVWCRQSIERVLAGDATEHISMLNARTTRLASDVILLTYTANRGGNASHRTSIWLRVGGSWQLRHHQGTSVPEE